MNNDTKKIVFFSTFVPSLLFSNGILNNIRGSVGSEYVLDNHKTESSTSKKNSLSNFVDLSYKDFIYNSNVIKYAAQIKFDLKDTKSTNNETSSSSSNQINDYDLVVKFFSNSFIPFTTTFSQKTNPTTSINSGGILETTRNKAKYALDGNVFLNNKLKINYGLSHVTNDTTTNTTYQDNIKNVYKFGIDKSFDNLFIKTYFHFKDDSSTSTSENSTATDNKYSFAVRRVFDKVTLKTKLTHQQINDEENLNNTENIKNALSVGAESDKMSLDVDYKIDETVNSSETLSNSLREDISKNFKWKITDKMSLSNSLIFSKEEVAKTDSISDYFNLSYDSKKKFRSNMSVYTNIFNSKEDTVTNNGLSVNSSYLLSKEFSTNQSASYFTNESSLANSKIANVDLSLNYVKPIFKESILRLYTKTSGLQSSGTEEEENGYTYSYDLSGKMNTKFHKGISLMNYGVNYYQSFSTLSSEEQTIRLNGAFSTKFIYNIDYETKADYSIRKSFPLDNGDNTVEKDLNVFNGFSIYKRLDIRGLLSANFGVNYSKKEVTDADTVSSLNPAGTASFTYMIWRNLIFKSSLNMSRDSITGIETRMNKNKLLYKLRKFTLELDASFNQQDGGDSGDTSSSLYKFMFKRKL